MTKLQSIMLHATVVLITVLFVSICYAGELPDSKLTPGALSPDVVRDVTVQELRTISTKTVRDVPDNEKKQVYAEYGLTGNHTGYCRDDSKYIEGTNNLKVITDKDEGCEVDHLCSLELGCNNNIKNLWPQRYFGACNAHQKDALENKLHKMIITDRITMQDAQAAISTNWILAYAQYVDAAGCE